MYSLHLTHVGEKASVNNTSSVNPRHLILRHGRWWLYTRSGSMYSSHIAHVDVEVSRSVSGIVCTATGDASGTACIALPRHMKTTVRWAIPNTISLSSIFLLASPLLGPSNYFETPDTRVILMPGRVRLAGSSCTLNTIWSGNLPRLSNIAS